MQRSRRLVIDGPNAEARSIAKPSFPEALVQHGSAETARSRFIDAAIAAGVLA